MSSTIQTLIIEGQTRLSVFVEEPRLEAEILLAFVLQENRVYLYVHFEKIISNSLQAKFFECLQLRIAGKPIAYIIQQKEFYERLFFVNESVLIPRPETEFLVDCVLTYSNHFNASLKALDLGTGSGIIGITLALAKPAWQIVAVDRSEDALQIAKKNAHTLGATNIKFFISDWFSELNNHKFDVIVSNPPYLASNDPHLAKGDLRFEPSSALIAEQQGLADYKVICEQVSNHLNPNGLICFEHGCLQGAAVREILYSYGFDDIQTIKDYAGLERVSFGVLVN